MNIVTCCICGQECKGNRGLAQHILNSHNEYNSESYYNEFIHETTPLCYCGNKKDFRGIGRGYLKYCSYQCVWLSDENRRLRSFIQKGRKQSKQQIEKRIKNTDQKKKEEKRQTTVLKRYGVKNITMLPHVRKLLSKANRGKKSPRTEEHQRKIIESKRRNGTLGHSPETKRKISKAVRDAYNSDSPPITVSCSRARGYKTGTINGIYYRSSYELAFIEYCVKNKIEIISAETSEFRIPYVYNGNKKMYYPDFYLPKYDLLVETKPISMIDHGSNRSKIDAALSGSTYPFVLVTEEELDDLDWFFKYL